MWPFSTKLPQDLKAAKKGEHQKKGSHAHEKGFLGIPKVDGLTDNFVGGERAVLLVHSLPMNQQKGGSKGYSMVNGQNFFCISTGSVSELGKWIKHLRRIAARFLDMTPVPAGAARPSIGAALFDGRSIT